PTVFLFFFLFFLSSPSSRTPPPLSRRAARARPPRCPQPAAVAPPRLSALAPLPRPPDRASAAFAARPRPLRQPSPPPPPRRRLLLLSRPSTTLSAQKAPPLPATTLLVSKAFFVTFHEPSDPGQGCRSAIAHARGCNSKQTSTEARQITCLMPNDCSFLYSRNVSGIVSGSRSTGRAESPRLPSQCN
ncbi:hypothetical protein EJB05_10724, partial [Eragrostis curvula]